MKKDGQINQISQIFLFFYFNVNYWPPLGQRWEQQVLEGESKISRFLALWFIKSGIVYVH